MQPLAQLMSGYPQLQIYHNWAPDYGPSGELRPTLEQQIAQLSWMQQNEPQKFNFWPFNNMGGDGSKELQKMIHDEAFQNPIPQHTGDPVYMGPYYVGSQLPHPAYLKGGEAYRPDSPDGYSTDASYTDAFEYSAQQGLISDEVAEKLYNDLLGGEEDDYISLVQAGDLSLEDAIRLMGYVPQRLQRLIGE